MQRAHSENILAKYWGEIFMCQKGDVDCTHSVHLDNSACCRVALAPVIGGGCRVEYKLTDTQVRSSELHELH